VVALWRFYGDEASDEQQQEDFIVGGVIAEKRQWQKIHKAWGRALNRWRPIPYDSAKEGGKRSVPGTIFYGWSDDDVYRKRMMLAHAIGPHVERQLVAAMQLRYFWPIVSEGPVVPAKWKDPYLPLFAQILQLTAHCMNELEASRSQMNMRRAILIFDQLSSTKQKSRVCAIYDAYASAPEGHPLWPVTRWITAPQFPKNKTEDPGLQVADLIVDIYRHSRRRAAQFPEGQMLPVPEILAPFGGRTLGIALQPEHVQLWKRALLSLLDERRQSTRPGAAPTPAFESSGPGDEPRPKA
jgi:hypothetical protein